MTELKQLENTDQEEVVVSTEAKKHGLQPSTVYKRLERGLRLDEALAPVGAYERFGANRDQMENVRAYIIQHKRATGGIPPSLNSIKDEMGFQSIGKARIVCENLVRRGVIKTTEEGGKIMMVGERWLSPRENAKFQRLLDMAQKSNDPRMQAVAKSLILEETLEKDLLDADDMTS